MSRSRRAAGIAGISALVLAFAAFVTACVPPTRIVVTTTTDELNNDGDCSLREAVRAANLNAAVDRCTAGTASDVIELAAGTYSLTIAGAQEQQGLTGDLDFLAGSVEIKGVSRTNTIIDGAGLERILDVFANVSLNVHDVMLRNGAPAAGRRGGAIVVLAGGSMALKSVDIQNNRTSDGPDRIPEGGAIYNDGMMTLDNALVRNNTAGGNDGSGGGIFNSGTMTLKGSRVSGNSATGRTTVPNPVAKGGGGIFNSGTMSMTDTTVTNNSTNWRGGGLAALGGTVTIVRSTFSANRAVHGAGIDTGSNTTATNVTISGNNATMNGGALFSSATNTVLTNVTIALNNSDSDANGTGDGGGIFVSAGVTRLRNSLFHDNKDLGGFQAPACRVTGGELRSEGYNKFGGLTNCTLTGDLTGNVVGGNAMVGPLADNGGPTQTHALLPGSPAIDAANPAAPGSGGTACAATDQRGVNRPRDGNGDSVARCDMGAFEL
jgi:CSLREA domain-containing protein